MIVQYRDVRVGPGNESWWRSVEATSFWDWFEDRGRMFSVVFIDPESQRIHFDGTGYTCTYEVPSVLPIRGSAL